MNKDFWKNSKKDAARMPDEQSDKSFSIMPIYYITRVFFNIALSFFFIFLPELLLLFFGGADVVERLSFYPQFSDQVIYRCMAIVPFFAFVLTFLINTYVINRISTLRFDQEMTVKTIIVANIICLAAWSVIYWKNGEGFISLDLPYMLLMSYAFLFMIVVGILYNIGLKKTNSPKNLNETT